MQAILLATGESNPLPPLTETIPSPMVPLANRPVMVYAVELLARQGIKHILVSLHTLAGEIEAYFGTGRRWGVHLHYILQREAWGTAGALGWAKHLLTETFLVMPADALVDVDLAAALEQHQAHQSQATVVLHATRSNEDGKQLHLSPEGQICANALPGASTEYWIDTGVYLFEPAILDLIPSRTHFDIHNQLIPALLAKAIPIYAYQMRGYWNPLDTFQKLYAAQRVALYSAWGNHIPFQDTPPLRFPVIEGRQIGPGIWVGRNYVIHPQARLASPVCIGDNCQIGQGVELGPDVVIGNNVMVDEEATISQSVILDRTYVGQLVNIDRRLVDQNLVIDIASAQNLRVADPFLLSKTPSTLTEYGIHKLAHRVVALGLLILFAPLFLPVSLLLWITNRRVFCISPRQNPPSQRSGQSAMGSPALFSLVRFCTRRPDGHPTRLGSWLESWEGHRLPELWNVVKGDMELVGVKPLTAEELDRLTASWQQKRNEGMPGFTGLWYTQTSRSSDLDEILVADAFYVTTRTWLKDLKLLIQTPLAWWRRVRESTSGRIPSEEWS